MSVLTNAVLEEFAGELARRLSAGTSLTEDSIRYSLYSALTRHEGVASSEVHLEEPHPALRGKKVDTYIPASGPRGETLWELKYDRRIPSARNQPRTQKVGALLNDVFRLAQWPRTDAACHLIYLTDDEMAKYMRNPANGFAEIFAALPGARIAIDEAFLATKALALRRKVKVPVVESLLIGQFQRDLPRGHYLRVFEVKRGR